METPETTRKAIETVWLMERPRLIGGLARVTRDLDLAEDLAQDALLTALEQWPLTGVPANPGAWLPSGEGGGVRFLLAVILRLPTPQE